MTNSRYIYSSSADIDLQLHEGKVTLRICDAETAYTDIDLDLLSEYATDDELAFDISREIEGSAYEIAETLVASLRERIEND